MLCFAPLTCLLQLIQLTSAQFGTNARPAPGNMEQLRVFPDDVMTFRTMSIIDNNGHTVTHDHHTVKRKHKSCRGITSVLILPLTTWLSSWHVYCTMHTPS